jgi:MFS family permease
MIASLHSSLRFARALKSQPFLLIWLGQMISNLGDGIFYVALAWQVLVLTGSGTAMGVVLLAGMVPRLIFTLAGGVAADRLPRRLILLWSDGSRGAVVLVTAVLSMTGHLQMWYLIIQALIFGIVDGFFTPTINAITPDIVEKDDLSSANALTSINQTIAQLFGPVVGASLVVLASPAGAFFADAASFFISVAFLVAVRIPARAPQTNAEQPASSSTSDTPELFAENVITNPGLPLEIAGERSSVSMLEETGTESISIRAEPGNQKRRSIRDFLADVAEGLDYVKSSRWIWITILVVSLGNIGFTTPIVAMPKLVHDVYGQGPWLYGLMGALSAVGGLIAMVAVGQATRWKRRGLLAYLSLLVTNIGIIILGLPFPRSAAPIIGPSASALLGFGLAFFNTIFFTVLQERVPSDKLGRVMSIDILGSFAMIPIADILCGVATDHIGPALVFLLSGLLNLVLFIVPLGVREIRELE